MAYWASQSRQEGLFTRESTTYYFKTNLYLRSNSTIQQRAASYNEFLENIWLHMHIYIIHFSSYVDWWRGKNWINTMFYLSIILNKRLQCMLHYCSNIQYWKKITRFIINRLFMPCQIISIFIYKTNFKYKSFNLILSHFFCSIKTFH